MSISELISLIINQADKVEFNTVIDVITEHYAYTPTRFTNGNNEKQIINNPGENEGSCKIFSFAKINQLNKDETLACFGKYYRSDVLQHPEKNDHGNIRTFMLYAWDGIKFDQPALVKK